MSDSKGYARDPRDMLTIRFPDGMRDRLHAVAKANGRSANAEMVARLEQSLYGDQAPPPAIKVPPPPASSARRDAIALEAMRAIAMKVPISELAATAYRVADDMLAKAREAS